MFDDRTFEELVAKCNKPHLAKESGMVYQVWGDGEVTLTKSGDLLGQRGLHMIHHPLTPEMMAEILPEQSGNNSFIYTDKDGADAVRNMIGLRYRAFIDSRILDPGDLE